MKTIIALVSVLAVFGASSANTLDRSLDLEAVPVQERLFEGLINSTINSVIAVVAQHDPMHKEHEEFDLFGHQGEINNLRASGFSNFYASHISMSGLLTWTLKLELEAPKTVGSVEHWKIDGNQIFGEGSGSFDIENIKISINAKINPLSVSLKSLTVTPSIGNANVVIKGLYNDEETSQKVSDAVNKFLNDDINNNTELHKKISDIIYNIVSNILGSML